jgi:ABC-type branched-subunit amino acid transport system substrate-binding protein
MFSTFLKVSAAPRVAGAVAVAFALAHCSSNTGTPQIDAGSVFSPRGDAQATNCADAGGAAPREKTNRQCTQDLGETAVYVASSKSCVKLKSQDCTIVEGSVEDDNTVLFGALLAQTGASAASGLARTNSARLAIRELNEGTRSNGGIPSPDVCASARPIALLACDDNEDPANNKDRKRAARHLVDDLAIPIILGGSTSGSTTDIATNVALPKKTVLFAPSSTAIAITSLANATADGVRLLWRAAPSDKVQSQVLALQLTELEKESGAGTSKLAIVFKKDAYGQGLADALRAVGTLNQKPFSDAANAANVIEIGYDPTKPADLQAAVASLTSFGPTLVLLAGTAETITGVMTPYEAVANVKPTYLIPDGPRKPELITALMGNDALRKRIRGTVPGVVTPLADNFFFDRYKIAFPENNPTLSYGMAGSYDAIYLFAYALASIQGEPTGVKFAAGLAKTAGASPRIDVGPASISQGIQTMTNGRTINFNGASGPLDFDPLIGEAPSDYTIFCVRFDDMGIPYYFDSTGQTYSAEQKRLIGAFKCQ